MNCINDRTLPMTSVRTTALLLAFIVIPFLAACGSAETFEAGQAAESNAQILFVSNGNVMLWRDGDISQLTDGVVAESPTWSPAGDRFAYVQVHEDYSDIVIADRDGDPLVGLTTNDSGLTPFTEDHVFLAAWAKEPDWSPVGEELVYISDKGGLDALSRNLFVWIAEFGVGATPYGLDASYRIGFSQSGPVYAPGGTSIALSVRQDEGGGVRYHEIWTLDLETGFFEPIVVGTDGAYDPDWSPDGEDLVYIQRNGDSTDLWIAPVGGGSPYRLADVGAAAEPVWSPDGTQIAFMRVVGVEIEVWVVDVTSNARGIYSAGEPEKLFSADAIDAPSGLSWFDPNP